MLRPQIQPVMTGGFTGICCITTTSVIIRLRAPTLPRQAIRA